MRTRRESFPARAVTTLLVALFATVNMSNSDLPEIAVLTRGLRTGFNQMLEQQGYLYVSRLRYDDNLKLTESIILAKTEVNAFASSDALCRHVGNMDLAFGFFRGREYTQDLEVSVAGGIATEHEVTMGSGQEYAVTDQHSVVMQATPFDTYRYEIFGSDDPDEEGLEFVVSMPRERAFVLMTLSKYVRLMAREEECGKAAALPHLYARQPVELSRELRQRNQVRGRCPSFPEG